ncbi:hypothetical protein CIG75_18000 [Tumebacillus algifaecis]|uniref:Uncharacterized protein n=1 Tax=Tumebacillus algifaecis TaxID=1214604 RepID=A0A223D5J0_9BACL|nr:hypothetical protein [Tumebacillus algifaecis]ASS76676.1 hypothetical protein CIG75_18000 [Tumebacillus algifaecis]
MKMIGIGILAAMTIMTSTAGAAPAPASVQGNDGAAVQVGVMCVTKTYTMYWDEWDYIPNTMKYGGETLYLDYFTDYPNASRPYSKAVYSNC